MLSTLGLIHEMCLNVRR